MMTEKSCNHHLLLIVLSISSLLFICFPGSTTCQAQPPPPALNLTMEQICQNTTYPSLCISTLTPFPSEIDHSRVILGMAVNATINATQVARAEATRLLSDPSTSTLYNGSIHICWERYDVAIQELQIAANNIAQGIDHNIVDWIEGAQDSYVICEIEYAAMDVRARDAGEYEAFVSWLPGDVLPFKLSDMVDNCLDISKLISWPCVFMPPSSFIPHSSSVVC